MSAVPAELPAHIGRYQVIDRIGRGGMAEVFLARTVGPGGIAKRLCVKRMLPDLMLAPRSLARFTEEARTVLALQHANIVPVFDFGRDGQNLYLAMEWIDGCDLAALLARGTSLPPAVAAHVAVEVARALAYAHTPSGDRPGLLHSDVTPRNVLLSRQGEVRLTDFGIARALGGAAQGGTPAYMAPEAARGEAVDASADLYSLGLVFVEMLLGRRLRGSNDLAAAGSPVTVPALDGIPAPFAEVARRLLAERQDRFTTAGEVVNALSAPLAAELVRGGEAPAQTLAALVEASAPARGADAAEGPLTEAPPTVDLPSLPRAPAPPRRGAPVLLIGGLLLGTAAVVAAGAALSRPPARAPIPERAPVRASPAPPPPAAIPAPAHPPPHPAAGAILRITTPGSWVEVYLDGRKLGEGPGLFPIPPGKHQLRVTNQPLGFTRTETLNAAPGATVQFTFHTRQ
jgi:tRNA A-37 threonylcarbamoyl transferase component Bud32